MSFKVLHFTFRSVIHFELTFVMSITSMSIFILCVWISNYSRTNHWKDYHVSAFALLPKINWQNSYGFVLGLSIHSTDVFVYSFTNTTLSWLLYQLNLFINIAHILMSLVWLINFFLCFILKPSSLTVATVSAELRRFWHTRSWK